MATKFEISARGLQALLTSPAMASAMVREAQGLRAAAEAAAPRRTGRLASSYTVEPVEVTTAYGRDGTPVRRAAGRLSNTAPHALAIEFGHRAPDGTPVPGAHTLGLLAGNRSARKRAGAGRRASRTRKGRRS